VRSVHDDVLGDFDIPGMPVKFSEWSESTDLTAAALGEHNAEVLKEYLGLSDDEIKQLYTNNILIEEAHLKF
jgi:CoA:oxalate CoA-transferase